MIERRRRFFPLFTTGFKTQVGRRDLGDLKCSLCFSLLRRRAKDEDKGVDLQEREHSIKNFIKWSGLPGSSGLLTL